jgi:hypothetical protein
MRPDVGSIPGGLGTGSVGELNPESSNQSVEQLHAEQARTNRLDGTIEELSNCTARACPRSVDPTNSLV